VEIHQNASELRKVFQNYSVLEHKLVVGASLLSVEDKELVDLLLVLDQLLAADDRQLLLILRLDHRNYLVWLTCVCLQK